MDDCRRPKHCAGSAATARDPVARARVAQFAVALLTLAPPIASAQVAGLWSPLPPGRGLQALVPARYGHSAVYDPVRARMLVYAGSNGDGRTIWQLDLTYGTGWSKTDIANGPYGTTYGQSAIYDPRRDRLLVFGGYDGLYASNNVINLRLDTTPSFATLAVAGTPPSVRVAHVAVYDPVRDRMIVFAGFDPTRGFLNDLWQLKLSGTPTWSPLVATGAVPPPRDYASAIYERARDRIVLFGGNVSGVPDAGLWELTLSGTPSWNPIVPAGGGPSPRFAHCAVHDSAARAMYVCGGYDGATRGDVWKLSLDGGGSWSQVMGQGDSMSTRLSATAIFDPVGRRVVISGGIDQASGAGRPDTPVLDVATAPPVWYLDSPAPSPRFGSTITYDPIGDRCILYGGIADNRFPDSNGQYWELHLSGTPAWTTRSVGNASIPAQRYGHAALYDPLRPRVLILGGYDGGFDMDVWSLPLTGTQGWTRIAPAGTAPSGRSLFSAVYDDRRDRVLIFGGNTGHGYLNDVWALSLSGTPAWQPVTVSGTPPEPRMSHAAVYDHAHDQMIVYGGLQPSSPNTPIDDDAWVLSLSPAPQWSYQHFGSASGYWPVHRYAHTMMVDPFLERSIMFGGAIGNTSYDEVWSLSLRSTVEWERLWPNWIVYPAARYGHAVAFDSQRDRMVMFGGTRADGFLFGDTYFLTWGAVSTPALLSVAEWSAGPDYARIVWYSGDAAGRTYGILRHDGGRAWSRIAERAFDGSGRLEFLDRSVQPGNEYVYGLQAAGEDIGAEARIRVPSRTVASLTGFAPNPAASSPVVRLVLPDAAPAVLEVIDVSGRVVWKRDVGPLGEGSHALALSGGPGLPPGVYTVRLRRRGAIFEARGAIVR